MKRNNIKHKKKFDEAEFDRKVCQITYNIHNKVKSTKMDLDYNKWFNQNIEHLENMYNLSELECDFEDFCNWVYSNSNTNSDKY